MSSCSNCKHGENIYTFSNESLSFKEAQNHCIKNGGKLARILEFDALAKSSNCCHEQRTFYWIGLKRVDASECSNRNTSGFQWINSQTCSDKPLKSVKLDLQPVNNKECKAVAIQFVHQKIHTTSVRKCDHQTTHYICQTKDIAKPIAQTTTSSRSTLKKISSSLPSEIIRSDSASSVGLIAGALTFCFLLLLLAGFLFYRRKNRSYLSKRLICFCSKKSKNATDETKNNETFLT